MTGVSPERAAYEAHHGTMCCPWEESTADERELWKRVAGAAINASPELAEARAKIDRLQKLVAEILGWFKRSSSSHAARVGQMAIARSYRLAELEVPEDLRGLR